MAMNEQVFSPDTVTEFIREIETARYNNILVEHLDHRSEVTVEEYEYIEHDAL